MNILWVTNIVFPKVAEKLNLTSSLSGGWLYNFADLLKSKQDLTLGIVSSYHGDKFISMNIEGVHYYLIPMSKKRQLFGDKSAVKHLKTIEQNFNPDLIHIHGSEFPLGLMFLKYFKDIKVVINIQTIAYRIAEEVDGGLSKLDYLWNYTFNETIKFKFPLMRRIYAHMRRINEDKYYKSANYVIGSTLWDESFIKYRYSHIKYYKCQYLFRKSFYSSKKWSYDEAEKNSILTGQAASPLKGLHILIKAIYHVKKSIPEIKLYIPGPDLLSEWFLKNYSYAKYINNLIRKYEIEDNVIFIGNLNESEMAEKMRQVQMVVVPSAIELGSSMVCEAMLLGVPLIASFRGGMTHKFQHGVSGFYYDYPEVYLLADYIHQLIRDRDLATSFSKKEMESAEIEHDQDKCVEGFYKTYTEIIND